MRVKSFLFVSLLFSGGVAGGVTISIPAMVDGFVQSTGVLGLSTGDADPTIRTSRSGGNNVRHGVYEFDLSTLPSSATIQSATLQLTTSSFISNTGGNPAPISVYGYTGDGAITVGDFGTVLTPPTSDAFLLLPTGTGPGSTPGGTTLDFVFTNLAPLIAANASGSDVFGARSQTIDFVSFQVSSLETATANQVPTLVINYVPEPGTAGLLLLSGLVLIRRRCRG